MKNEVMKREINITELQEKYLRYLDVTKNTVITYKTGIKGFINFLQERRINEPTRENIIEYREFLREKHSVKTVNTYIIALRNFFKFLSYEGLYPNIAENIKNLSDTNLHTREALTVEQCQKILDSVKNLREKTMFLLFLSCGLRVSELANIRLQDFEVKNDKLVLYVLGKGRSSRQDYVIIPNEMIDILKEYVMEYKVQNYLFTSVSYNKTNKRMASSSIRNIINDLYERNGLKKDTITLHSLRHTFATISIQSGMDIREVSNAMRHHSVATTEIYLHDLETINNKCSNTVLTNVLNIQ